MDNPLIQKDKLLERYSKKGYNTNDANFIVELELAKFKLFLSDQAQTTCDFQKTRR